MKSANKLEIRTLAGKLIQDESDWERVDAMTDEEATQAALAEQETRPVADWSAAMRIRDLSGDTLVEKLRFLKKCNSIHTRIKLDNGAVCG